MAQLGPREQRGDLGCAEQRASWRPTDRVVRRPTSATVGRRRCVPHRRGGSTRAEASGPGRAAARPAGDSPRRPRCRPVDRPPARRCRAPSNTHREPVASMAAATWVAKLGASSSPRASRSRCRAPSRPASARARVVFPLPAQPITTIRSGIGSVGAGQLPYGQGRAPVVVPPGSAGRSGMLGSPGRKQVDGL
jgi:hypothetical protein